METLLSHTPKALVGAIPQFNLKGFLALYTSFCFRFQSSSPQLQIIIWKIRHNVYGVVLLFLLRLMADSFAAYFEFPRPDLQVPHLPSLLLTEGNLISLQF